MAAKRIAMSIMAALACAPLVPLSTATAASTSSTSESGTSSPSPQSIWSDPEFQKQFLASFGALSDLEPRVNPVEKQQLEKLIPLLGSDPAAAERELLKIATPQSTALFDFT